MLQFISMTLDNFGPYKGTNTINFKDCNGVTIFWGDNGRGKTTLLNAFRFALFGTIQRRHGTLRSFREMENYESRNENKFGYSVSIHMKNDDEVFELIRAYTLRSGVTIPVGDSDYEKKIFLKMNGSILSPQDRDHMLNTLMPEQVSRFFLFDGELLQEYEELVMDEVNSGERIKESIEKILGVPVLQNSAIDLSEIKDDYERQKTKSAQKDQKTKLLAGKLSGIEASLSEHQAQIDYMKHQLEELFAEKRETEKKLKDTEKIRSLIVTRDSKEEEKKQAQQKYDTLLLNIKEITKECWRGLLGDRIKEATKELSTAIAGLENKKKTKYVADNFMAEIKKACADRKCPVCTQKVSDSVLSLLQEQISLSEARYSGLTVEEGDVLLSLQAQIATLKKLKLVDKKQALEIYEHDLEQTKIDIVTISETIEQLNEKIATYKETDEEGFDEIGTLTQKFSKVEVKISNLQAAIAEEKSKREETLLQKAKLSDQISKNADSGELLVAACKQELAEKIHYIFREGISVYRDRLKDNVERDATNFFVQISNDADYTSLQINENYGLNILHKSGNIVPGRSAGYEHVVALSLIAALHKNSPLQGPIIMDSPFGRLDPTHKRNIVKALPIMADQTMLLVYTDEIDAQLTREALGNSLLAEHRLEKVTSMHTKVE